LYEQQVEDFQREGFCVFPQFFSPPRMEELEENLQRYVREVVPTLDTSATMYEDKSDPNSLFRLEKMQQHDTFFRDLLNDKSLAELAQQLLGDAVEQRGIELFAKAPRVGTATPPHQDGHYFQLTPNNALTFWLAIDRADNENGCVRYITGSHLDGLRPHAMSGSFGFSLGVSDFGQADRDREKAVVIDPGDMIAHHSLTIHRTDENSTDRLRRAIGIVFYGATCEVNREATLNHAKAVKAEWKSQGRL